MLNPPSERKSLHNRDVSYRGYARADGLFDLEGELLDTKHYGYMSHEGPRPAGQAIHRMRVRVTVDDALRIQAIQTSMDNAPFGECGEADKHMQRMVGVTLGPGWRKAIDSAIGGSQGCTHMRELLFNLATLAFQTIPHYQEHLRHEAGLPRVEGDQPPFYMGKCMSWDFDGPVIARVAPQFIGWGRTAPKSA